MDRGSQLSRRTRRTTRGGGQREEEDNERRRRGEEEEEEEDQATDIKSNNPHLAGGEKTENGKHGFDRSHGMASICFDKSRHRNVQRLTAPQ